MMKTLLICFVFCLSCYIAAQYICSSIDQADKGHETDNVLFQDFEPIDLSYQDKWPVQKWKIKDRDLNKKRLFFKVEK